MGNAEQLSPLNGRYTLHERLQHRDGQSTYRAWDLHTDTGVILKVLSLEHVQNWEALEGFEREVKTLASLRHPAIPQLLAHFRSESPPAYYLVQEAIAGTTLRERFAAGLLTEAEALDVAEQVLEILTYLQGLHPPVIHRDIKPENLLQDAAGKMHLIDFGAVRDAARQHQFSVAGTFGYMAPEQAAGQVHPASDLYALGVTLIEGLSGVPPQALAQDQDLRLRFQHKIDVSPRMAAWLTKMVDPVVSQRPLNAAEALVLLHAEAPSEAVGRVKVQFPTAEETLIQILPRQASLTVQQLFLRSLIHQGPKFLTVWFFQFIMVTALFNLLLANPLPYLHVYNLIEQLMSFGLLGVLLYVEWQALVAQDRQVQSLLLKGSHVYYNAHAYALGSLDEIAFGNPIDFKGLERTKVYLKFARHRSLRLPAMLSVQEQQLLIHTLEKHGQKHLSQAEFQRLKQAPSLG